MGSPSQIRVLSDTVANKIAAGEVVERPASVLKELVENAVDAGSSRIDVAVASGGRKLISVADNGAGMTRDDALLSVDGEYHLIAPADEPARQHVPIHLVIFDQQNFRHRAPFNAGCQHDRRRHVAQDSAARCRQDPLPQPSPWQ